MEQLKCSGGGSMSLSRVHMPGVPPESWEGGESPAGTGGGPALKAQGPAL